MKEEEEPASSSLWVPSSLHCRTCLLLQGPSSPLGSIPGCGSVLVLPPHPPDQDGERARQEAANKSTRGACQPHWPVSSEPFLTPSVPMMMMMAAVSRTLSVLGLVEALVAGDDEEDLLHFVPITQDGRPHQASRGPPGDAFTALVMAIRQHHAST